jgi:hypothetical protein
LPKAEISDVLADLLKEGFFSEWTTSSDVIKKLGARGFTIKGKEAGVIGRMLTQMCQDSSTGMEREEIPTKERKGSDRWKYKKVR